MIRVGILNDYKVYFEIWYLMFWMIIMCILNDHSVYFECVLNDCGNRFEILLDSQQRGFPREVRHLFCPAPPPARGGRAEAGVGAGSGAGPMETRPVGTRPAQPKTDPNREWAESRLAASRLSEIVTSGIETDPIREWADSRLAESWPTPTETERNRV